MSDPNQGLMTREMYLNSVEQMKCTGRKLEEQEQNKKVFAALHEEHVQIEQHRKDAALGRALREKWPGVTVGDIPIIVHVSTHAHLMSPSRLARLRGEMPTGGKAQ